MTETEHNTPQKTTKGRVKIHVRVTYIIVLAVILVICSFHAFKQLTNSVSATIRINTVSSADGKNPDGSPFTIMDLFQDDIMNRAAQKLDGKLTAEELRSHLSISDTMSGNSYTKLEQSIYNNQYEDTYFPTEYRITYSTITQEIENEGFIAQCECIWKSFSLPSKTEILHAVLESYQEYYAETYLDYEPLFDIDWTTVDSMDYYNRFEFMNDTLQRLNRFLEYKNNRSLSQHENHYDDLLVELSQGPAQNIKTYQAYITQNGVTSDRDELIRQFVYMQNLSEEENARKMQEYQVLREAVEMYDSTTTKVVFIPALDEEKAFYMNRTKVGLDYLSEKADAAKLDADSAAYSAQHYSYLQTCFADTYIVDENGNQTQTKNTPAQRTHADELYQRLKEEIQHLTKQTQLLTSDGNKTTQQDLVVSGPFRNVGIISVAMSSAKQFMLLLMAAYVVGYSVNAMFWKKSEGKMEEKE